MDVLNGTNCTVFVVDGSRKPLSENLPCARVVNTTHNATLSDLTWISIVPSALAAFATENDTVAFATTKNCGKVKDITCLF